MKRDTTVKIVLCALFTAIVIALSQVAIPMPSGVPVTLQTFAVALCGYMLGAKWGTGSIGIYILLGAAGVPVFSNFKGGIGALIGVTGGFIFGFILLALFCGLPGKKAYLRILFGVVGLIFCHLIGVVQYSLITRNPFMPSFLLVSAPYLIKDVISVAGAYLCSVLIGKALKKAKVQ